MSPTRQLTPSESHRLVPVHEVEVVPGITPGTWMLVVRGTVPCTNMAVTLEPVVYIRQPEYWRIEVVGTLPGGICLPALRDYAAALPLAGAVGSRGIEVVGQDFAQKLEVPPVQPEGTRVFQVGGVTTAVLESAPPQLRVSATGTASTPGWVNPRLEPLGDGPGTDGVMEFAFVADPPEGPALQVLAPIAASTTWTGYGAHEAETTGVRVLARTNEMEARIRPPAPPPSVQQELRLTRGAPATLQDLTLELLDVSDSRCPSQVVCVWQGMVQVEVEARIAGGEAARVSLSSLDERPAPLVDGWVARLVHVMPYPQAGPLPDEAYTVTLLVAKP